MYQHVCKLFPAIIRKDQGECVEGLTNNMKKFLNVIDNDKSPVNPCAEYCYAADIDWLNNAMKTGPEKTDL
ncbi:hypothetical protein RvY_01964 [Ramazzottius varieornatus]|uniref:Uncharacterized protein n=1 Tax=Ramazzottius varieornatus TaxID=947166 RepID=A0A1D1USS5_RAMVA|nr:hypothetical protein RvY_01964 [Ramazzottius varieornatus]